MAWGSKLGPIFKVKSKNNINVPDMRDEAKKEGELTMKDFQEDKKNLELKMQTLLKDFTVKYEGESIEISKVEVIISRGVKSWGTSIGVNLKIEM